jgi:hypothetical protein
LYTESNTHARMKPKEPKFDQKKEIRAIARERIGAVKPSHPIVPKTSRKKPKYKRPIDVQAE